MHCRQFLLVAGLIAASATLGCPRPYGLQYRVDQTSLYPQPTQSHSTMNAEGAVLGYAEPNDGGNRVPAVWLDGETTLLEVPEPILGAVAGCITDSGTVIGSGSTSTPVLASYYLLWASGSAHAMYQYVDSNVYVAAVSEDLTAVGNLQSIIGDNSPVLFSSDGHAEPLSSESWIPTDINEWGEIVGCSGYASNIISRPLLWTEDEGVHELEASAPAEAMAINDLGTIVGSVQSGGSYSQQACLWQDGEFFCLGMPQGFDMSRACDINNSGWVVGYAQKGVSVLVGVLWRPRDDGSYEAIDLQRLLGNRLSDYYLEYAISINDSGQILAVARPRIGFGESMLFRLTPVSK